MFDYAITRRPCAALGQGLTTAALGAPDHTLALRQHEAYVQALRACGLEVLVLEPVADHPDAHFVEDCAVLLPEVAVVTRPGALARRGEVASVAEVLPGDRPQARIEAPGTLEGGDVLVVGRQVLIGISERSNRAGAAQLGAIVASHGYTWTAVPLAAGLHLKSSVNLLTAELLLVTAAFAERPELAGWRRLVVPADEDYAANSLRINEQLLVPGGFPATEALLRQQGFATVVLDTSEMRKMDGGLTCLSLRTIRL